MLANLFRGNGRSNKAKPAPAPVKPVKPVTTIVQSTPETVSHIRIAPDKTCCVVSIMGNSGMIDETVRRENATILERLIVQSENGFQIDKAVLRAKHINLSRMLTMLPREVVILHGRIGQTVDKVRWIVAPKDGQPHAPILVTRISAPEPKPAPQSAPVAPEPAKVKRSKSVKPVQSAPVTPVAPEPAPVKPAPQSAPVAPEPAPQSAPVKPVTNGKVKPVNSQITGKIKCMLCVRMVDRLDGYAHCPDCAQMRKSGKSAREIVAFWLDKAKTEPAPQSAPAQSAPVKPVTPAKVKRSKSAKPVQSAPVAPAKPEPKPATNGKVRVQTEIDSLLSGILG